MNQTDIVKSWLNKNLPEAYSLHNDNYSMLLMFATIDCFAQAWGESKGDSPQTEN